MDVIHELASNRLICLFATMSIGYMLGKIRIKNFTFGSTIWTLIVGVLISCLGGTLDPKSEPFYFSMFLFAVGYDGGENITKIFNRSAIKSILLSFVMMLSALLSIIWAMKLFHLSKGMAVGVAAGALTQSGILGAANDSVITLTNLSPTVLAQYNVDSAEGFSVSYFFGLVGAIIWCSIIVEVLFRRKIHDDAVKVARILDYVNPVTKNLSPEHGLFVLCNGLLFGVLLGFLQVKVFGVTIKLGITGCLISGLLFGYINHKKPDVLVLSQISTKFIQDFGLSAFIAAVGLTSGSKVVQGIMRNGVEVIAASLLVAIIPLFISTLVGFFILRYKNTAILAGALAGARTASAASGVVLHKAGNSVPMQYFMISFVFSSILLTFLGPIIILLL